MRRQPEKELRIHNDIGDTIDVAGFRFAQIMALTHRVELENLNDSLANKNDDLRQIVNVKLFGLVTHIRLVRGLDIVVIR